MPRRFPWRVRVKQQLESWCDVEAFTALEAESEAYKAPGVVSVFPGSAIRADVVAESERPVGVRDD
jgi:hypothetical protein